MLKIIKLFKESDYFGIKAEILFDNKSSSFKTVFGGIISTILNLLYFAYFLILLNQMFTYNNDSDKIIESGIDLDNEKPINFNETNLMIFIWFEDLETST